MKKRFFKMKLTESQIKKIIKESVFRLLNEAEMSPDKNYTHYAVNKSTGKIVNGWDYRGYDSQDLRTFAKDYFFVDLTDMELNPKDYKIIGKATLLKRGIDPQDWNNWAQS